MFHQTLLAAVIALASVELPAPEQETNPQIDYQGFLELTSELGEVRAQHRLPLAEFLDRARADGAILLDTRSAAAFEAGHLEGAVNLPFSDFTDEKLAEVIGQDADRPIFIYCNNNFSDNVAPVTSKRAPLALNIPTFINLHGYGYTNVWELADVVTISQVPWVTGSPRR